MIRKFTVFMFLTIASTVAAFAAESFTTIPANIDFGRTRVNTPKRMEITLKNTGDSTLVLQFYLKRSKQFYLETDTLDVVMPKNATISLDLVYIPSAETPAGKFDTDSLVVQTETNTFFFAVKGQAITPKIEVEDWNTGIVGVGENFCKKQKTGTGVKVRNTGSDTLIIFGVTYSGSIAPFVFTPPAFPINVLPGKEYYFDNVCFNPTQSGTWSYNLIVNSNAVGTDSVMALRGESKFTMPYIGGADFGLRRRLTKNDTILTIKNANTAAVKIADVKLTGSTANFVIDFANISPKIGGGTVVDLQPETASSGIREIKVPVSYIPNTEGPHEAQIIVVPGQSGIPENSISANLKGIGYEPTLTIEVFEWPDIPFDTVNNPVGEIILSNSSLFGATNIKEIRWAPSSANQKYFSLVGEEFPKNVSVPKETPVSFRIQFTPDSVLGQKVALIEVVSDRGPGPNKNPQVIDTIRLVANVIDTATSVIEAPDNIIKVYPNPAADLMRIEANNVIIKALDIISHAGETIHIEASSEVNVSSLPQGAYYLRITTNSKIYFKKFIIKR